MEKTQLEPEELKIHLPVSPVALVATVSGEGKANVFTVICLGVACKRPPMLSVAVHPFVHSHSLIKATGEMTVNFPTAELLKAVKVCGSRSGRDVDKFAAAGLTAVPATKVKPPLVGECPVSLECVVKHSLSLGVHELFVVEVVAAHIADGLDATNLLCYVQGRYLSPGKPLGKAKG